MLRVPFLRRFYLRRMLKYLEETRRSDLPAELQPLQAVLNRLPKAQRLGALEAALAQGPNAPAPSRSLRRAADREQRRAGRRGRS